MEQKRNQIDPILISLRFSKIKKKIVKFVEKSVDVIDKKISHFMNRCFPRWIFNAIKNGKNPFIEIITYEDFVIYNDLDYFFERHKYLNFDHTTLNWDWLNEEFRLVHCFSPEELRKSPVQEFLKVNPILSNDNHLKINSNPMTENQIKPSHLFSSSKYSNNYSVREILRKNSSSSIDIQIVGHEYLITYNSITSEHKKYMINVKQYRHLLNSYVGERNLFHNRITIMISRYYACGGLRNHFSVPPEVIDYTGAQTELFGSPFNTHLDQFCSPFHDVEFYFGSMGSFFDFEMKTGTYILNPPYDEELIEDAMVKVISALETNQEITVICVIPMWDIESQEIYKGGAHSERDFECIKRMTNSSFCQSNTILSYTTHKFYDYYETKNIYISDVHLIIMTNTRYHLSATEISNRWKLV
tara:strand:- start:15354 stop:16598 length:1245 start_codon:yes stop_codon:yes gene_type:complete